MFRPRYVVTLLTCALPFVAEPCVSAQAPEVSAPAHGSFLATQSLLGFFLFGPAAYSTANSSSVQYSFFSDDNPYRQGSDDAGGLAYIGTVLLTVAAAVNALDSNRVVTRAQSHLAWDGAIRGDVGANLLYHSITGDKSGGSRFGAAVVLAGGVAGDITGFVLGRPMNDAEAHGAPEGSTMTSLLAAGLFAMNGAYAESCTTISRVASAAVLGAGVAGYPLGLRYARNTSYRVTAGDVTALQTAELLGISAAAALAPSYTHRELYYGVLTAGVAAGAFAGDRLLVRPLDHTESEGLWLEATTLAGALAGSQVALQHSNNTHVIFGATTIGALTGAAIAEMNMLPRRANASIEGESPRASSATHASSRVSIDFTPESLVLAEMKLPGNHSIVSMTF